MRPLSQRPPTQESEEKWIVRSIREISTWRTAAGYASEAAQERWRLRDKEARASSLRLKHWAKKLACYPFANRAGLNLLSKIERTSSWRFRTTNEYGRLFRELKPRWFSTAHTSIAGGHPGRAGRAVARDTDGHLHLFVDNLSLAGPDHPAYDYYLVWNEAIRISCCQLQFDPTGTGLRDGHSPFDLHFRREFYWTREEFCSRVGADPTRPIVLYSTGMANHMPGEPQIVEEIAAR